MDPRIIQIDILLKLKKPYSALKMLVIKQVEKLSKKN